MSLPIPTLESQTVLRKYQCAYARRSGSVYVRPWVVFEYCSSIDGDIVTLYSQIDTSFCTWPDQKFSNCSESHTLLWQIRNIQALPWGKVSGRLEHSITIQPEIAYRLSIPMYGFVHFVLPTLITTSVVLRLITHCRVLTASVVISVFMHRQKRQL